MILDESWRARRFGCACPWLRSRKGHNVLTFRRGGAGQVVIVAHSGKPDGALLRLPSCAAAPAGRSYVLDDGTLVVVSGRLDVHVAADVRNALAAAVDRGEGELVLDLAAVEAVDATGLGVLVGAHRRAQRAGRTLVLESVPAPVSRLLLVTRLDKVLHVRGAERCA